MTRIGLSALALVLAVSLPASARSSEVEDVKSSRGETTRIMIETADDAWATAVLFAGGGGGMELSKSGDIGNLKLNFLIRARRHLRAHGIHTVVIDAPSDRSDVMEFRATAGHAEDVGAVIRHLRAKFKLPVWVIGTSNGTTSAANAGLRLTGDARPDGVVVSSTRLASTAQAASLLDMDVDKITGPVLIVHHRHDNCFVTQPERVPDLAAALNNAKPVKVLWFEGGSRISGDTCGALHYHGFRGIEVEVMDAIAAWMRHPAP